MPGMPARARGQIREEIGGPRSKQNDTERRVNDWKLPDGRWLRLLALPELRKMQADEPDRILTDISGGTGTARDADDDVRYGFVAYGFVLPSPAEPKEQTCGCDCD